MNNFKFELASISHIEEIDALYDSITSHLSENTNYAGWIKGVYPVRKTAEDAIEDKNMFILTLYEKLVASVILNDIQPKSYDTLNWGINAQGKEVLVIHTLCVHPDILGKGIASKLIDSIENYAKSINAKTIRFDTHIGNIPATSLYLKKGYSLVGDISLGLDYDIVDSFKCFEKIIV